MHWQVLQPCRSVLLYNKHGLLMDAFMKEYREQCGKPLPFKYGSNMLNNQDILSFITFRLFGFTSAYDFLGSLKDVLEVSS